MSELFLDIDALDLAYQYLGLLGDFKARELSDLVSRLAYDLGIECAVDDNGVPYLVALLRSTYMAAAGDELGLGFLVDALFDDNGLLGSADHTVIEGLGMDYRVDSQLDVGGLVDDGGSVARAYADSGLAAGISALDHSGTAGRKDDVSLFHNEGGHFQRGDVYPADDIFGSARSHRSLIDDARSLDGALLGSRMGRDDDAVPCFEAEHCFEDRGRGGIGGGYYSRNDTDGLQHFFSAEDLVLLDNAAGLGILVGVVDILGGKIVFDDLVLDHAHACFFNCELGKTDSCHIGGDGGSLEDLVHLLLRVCGKLLLSFLDLFDLGFEGFYRINEFCFGHKITSVTIYSAAPVGGAG